MNFKWPWKTRYGAQTLYASLSLSWQVQGFCTGMYSVHLDTHKVSNFSSVESGVKTLRRQITYRKKNTFAFRNDPCITNQWIVTHDSLGLISQRRRIWNLSQEMKNGTYSIGSFSYISYTASRIIEVHERPSVWIL